MKVMFTMCSLLQPESAWTSWYFGFLTKIRSLGCCYVISTHTLGVHSWADKTEKKRKNNKQDGRRNREKELGERKSKGYLEVQAQGQWVKECILKYRSEWKRMRVKCSKSEQRWERRSFSQCGQMCFGVHTNISLTKHKMQKSGNNVNLGYTINSDHLLSA